MRAVATRESSSLASAETAGRRWSRLRTAAAIVWREFAITRSYRTAFAFELFFGFANLVIYYYISQTIGDVERDLGAAPDYFAFAAIGISLIVVIQAAASGLARRLREEQLTGTLEAIVAEPVRSSELAIGMAGFPFLFAVTRTALYLLVGTLFLGLDLSNADLLGLVTLLLLAGPVLAAIGIVIGALVLVLKRADGIIVLIGFALGFGGGAYFPTEILPDVLQPLVEVVPTRFAFDGMREAAFTGEGWADDAVALGLIALIAAPLAAFAFDRALRHTRRNGTLAQY
jgi:ABC-2 type transport system permease protein